MARFTLPRDLYHGPNALEALKTLPGKRAMICVGGGSMKRFGFLDRAEAYLKEAGMEVELFEGIEPDPSVETVMKGAAAMEKFQPDWIVAIGGGSPIDAAKAMWIKYESVSYTHLDVYKRQPRTCAGATPTLPTPRSKMPASRPAPMNLSSASPISTRPTLSRAATTSPAARSSASALPARC